MGQAYVATEEAFKVITDWRLKKTAGSRTGELVTAEDKEELKRQQQRLERERQEFLRAKSFEEKRLAREKRIFDMEWQMLEEEWRRLAVEKERMGHTKSQSGHTSKESDTSEHVMPNDVCLSLFFSGVKNMRMLRKSYRDLIKIFHPDNVSGDTGVIQKINEEYEMLKRRIERNR